jgi:hypothetical protein
LFNAFEEAGENMPLSDLQEEEEDEDESDHDRRQGRSLVGSGKARREEEGGRHPAYAGED